jgi:hypothetical protein
MQGVQAQPVTEQDQQAMAAEVEADPQEQE